MHFYYFFITHKQKDQGKDGFWYDEKDNIVLQAKCYQDFQNLFKKLKGEVKKVEKLQPKRYILVVSLPLSAGEAEKIRELFGGWIRKSEDLIDGNMLNSLLSDPDYRWIEKNFTGLWMPDGAVLEELLADALQKGRRMRNAREWRKAVEACRSFVQTNVYEEAAKRLEQDHVVVLSGQPGMGKTTIARILALGFLKPDPEEKAAEVHFTCIPSRIKPAPLATISSPTERPLSTIYSRPSSMSETWMSEETALPSTTL